MESAVKILERPEINSRRSGKIAYDYKIKNFRGDILMGGAIAFLLIIGLYTGIALGLYFGLRKFKII